MAAFVIGVAAFYLDADVHVPMVELLEARGHTVLMTRQVTSVNAPDDEQLLTATDLGRFLISHNKKDYLLLCKAWRSFARRWDVKEVHAGVLVVPQPVTVP